jgi:hypothetical protein
MEDGRLQSMDSRYKDHFWEWWLKLVILVTWEVEFGRITFLG